MNNELREIPRERWADYLNALSNRRKDAPVRLHVSGGEAGDRDLATDMPLLGISCEEKGSEKNAIEITLAKDISNLTHFIEGPQRISVREDNTGDVAELDIEGQGRIKAVIFFQEGTTVNR